MDEQNTNIENEQIKEQNEKTANVKSKKTVSKKTILIASIVAVVAILATVICIIAFGKSPEEKAILGEWYCSDVDSMRLKFIDNGSAELSYGSRIVDLEWEYDKENKNYRANAGGQRITFTMYSEEGLTFISESSTGLWFREEDKNLTQAQSSSLRNNIINRKLQDKLMITLGEAFSTENAIIVFNTVVLNDAKTSVICDITITAKKDLTPEDLKNLIEHDRNICFESTMSFISYGATGSGAKIITENNLVAEESRNFSFEINVRSADIETWGIYHGYSVFEIEGTEYRLDLREYTKQ